MTLLPKVVGHRGIGKHGLAPENTLKSFILCMEKNIPVCRQFGNLHNSNVLPSMWKPICVSVKREKLCYFMAHRLEWCKLS